jgi:hypothetical protein
MPFTPLELRDGKPVGAHGSDQDLTAERVDRSIEVESDQVPLNDGRGGRRQVEAATDRTRCPVQFLFFILGG